ncbi:MAG: MBL fold metallo-hydrolase [bacterium]|nr:MBL fold metallo-hydrolase [bacterium]
MGYEIDFLPAGGGSHSGDAITLRFGNLYGTRQEQTVIVIDGGFKSTGEKLVEHIRTTYGTAIVDLVISTHPDSDHTNGLAVVLEELEVKNLAMHQPWKHTEDIADLFKDGRVTNNSVSEHLQRSLESAKTLEEIAQSKGIPIIEPFEGTTGWDGTVRVVGPSVEYYESLLPEFRGTPDAASPTTVVGKAARGLMDFVRTVAEGFGIETLGDDGETSAENNSSVILLLSVNGQTALLMGDAGMPALTRAADYLDSIGFNSDTLQLIQVPHHGSRRNVGPTILDRLLGPRLDRDQKLRTALVSCAPDGAPKHPAKKVTNAFRRRGAWVYEVKSATTHHSRDAPDRGWVQAVPTPVYDVVEE